MTANHRLRVGRSSRRYHLFVHASRRGTHGTGLRAGKGIGGLCGRNVFSRPDIFDLRSTGFSSCGRSQGNGGFAGHSILSCVGLTSHIHRPHPPPNPLAEPYVFHSLFLFFVPLISIAEQAAQAADTTGAYMQAGKERAGEAYEGMKESVGRMIDYRHNLSVG